MISGLAYQLPEEGLFSLAGTLLAAPELAAVAAFTLFLRPFGMLFDSFNQILLTELARHPRIRYWTMLAALAGLTVGVSLMALLLVPLAAHLLYNGRYDSYQYLVPLLIFSASLQLFEVLGRAFVNARAPLPRVNLFIAIHTGLALAGAAFTLLLVKNMGIIGLALGTALIYVLRNLVSYAFSWQLNRQTRPEAVVLPTH
jgi:O-antigen/teichoic acid export membrane protein